jgi:hypothetical protein
MGFRLLFLAFNLWMNGFSVLKACPEYIEGFGFTAKSVLCKTFGTFQWSIPNSGYYASSDPPAL